MFSCDINKVFDFEKDVKHEIEKGKVSDLDFKKAKNKGQHLIFQWIKMAAYWSRKEEMDSGLVCAPEKESTFSENILHFLNMA